MSRRFAKDAALLFAAMRAGDLVAVAAGMWFVPKYVSQTDIGALLPLTSFATFLSLPAFALAMTVMKEAAVLFAGGERGKLKTLLRGVFRSMAALSAATVAVAALAAPRFVRMMGLDGDAAGFLAVSAAFLGCVAPVWTDALQALKRFRALALVEVSGAAARFAAMAVTMPAKALAGFFAGQATLPAFRILASTLALRRDLQVAAEPFWNLAVMRRMGMDFLAILVYQGVPMAVSLLELSILRASLSPADSAGYYMVSRFSDFLHCLTLPMLLVMFPYTATAAMRGDSTRPYVLKCAGATLAAAGAMALAYAAFGKELLSLMPNGQDYAGYALFMPVLTLAAAMTSCQVFFTNAEVSAGRFRFLAWFLPLHLLYGSALCAAAGARLLDSLPKAVACFAAAGAARLACTALHLRRQAKKVTS
jgi:hypothetical protein